jgi:hypothetical protein
MCTATGCQPNVYCHRVSTKLQLTNISIPIIPWRLTFIPTRLWRWNCSETLAYKIQTPGNYPEDSIQHLITLYQIQYLINGTWGKRWIGICSCLSLLNTKLWKRVESGPGVDSASNRKEYQEFRGGKEAGAWFWQTYHLQERIVL